MTAFHLTPKSMDLKISLHIHDFHAMIIIISPPIFRDPRSTHTLMKWVYVLLLLLGDPNSMAKPDWTKREYLTQAEPIWFLLLNIETL